MKRAKKEEMNLLKKREKKHSQIQECFNQQQQK